MDGILLINKPKGITSRDVVNEIVRILKIQKVGHTGTLDPMATGVLVLCVGKATKITSLITNYDKEYIAEITLGIETDTLDIEGSIIREEVVKNITREQVKGILNSFIGIIEQEVPKYSAVKVGGKKLYQYARDNVNVTLPTRKVTINKLQLVSELDIIDNRVRFKIECNVSKGTYIRSLIRDIGHKLNTVACMSSLERTKQGIYKIEDCYLIEDIKNKPFKLISIYDTLKHLPMVIVNNEMEVKIRYGAVLERFFDQYKAVIINQSNEVIAIYQTYEKDESKVKPYIMLI